MKYQIPTFICHQNYDILMYYLTKKSVVRPCKHVSMKNVTANNTSRNATK